MAVSYRAFVVAAMAVIAVAGIAIGAESQKETFLHPEKLQEAGLTDASSNLIALTAMIPATAIMVAAAVMARVPWTQRIVPLIVTWASTYFTIALVQSSFPNYDAIVEERAAVFSITPLISNGGQAVPSVFLGPIAIIVTLVIVLYYSLRHLLRLEPRPMRDTPSSLLRRFSEAYALAVPFLVILIVGNIRLLLGLPDEQVNTAPFLAVFPLSALAAAGLIVTGAMKLWTLGSFARNGLLADSVSETWQVLRWVEWILAAILGGLALIATGLDAIQHTLLDAGRTFSMTTRGHTQGQFLLLLPVVMWLMVDQRVQRVARDYAGHNHNLDVAADPLVIGVIASLALGAVGAFIAAWAFTGPLWAWVFAFAPIVAFSWFRFSGLSSIWLSTVLAVVLWGIGNTITGLIALNEEESLLLDTTPGQLSMFRALAALVLAFGLARLVRSNARDVPRPAAWALAILISTAVALLVFLELAFTAWILPQEQGEFVGIGSIVASQTRAVQMTLHSILAVFAAGSALAVCRIHRPDWFTRRQSGLPELAGADAHLGS